MSSLTEFLLARIAEDRGVAGGAWRDSVTRDGTLRRWEGAGPCITLEGTGDVILEQTPLVDPSGAIASHAARHDPARVLAECEAKRRIVESVEWALPRGTNGLAPSVLRHLAAVYAEHPDYDPDWAVQ